MPLEDLIFYVLDTAVFALLIKMYINCKQIEVEVKVSGKWIIPVMFLVVGGISFFRYDGAFKYIQTAILLAMAVMYYNMKSGLSSRGIVSMGSLTKYEKAGKLSIDHKDHAVCYGPGRRQGFLYFDVNQEKEISEYIQRLSSKVTLAKQEVKILTLDGVHAEKDFGLYVAKVLDTLGYSLLHDGNVEEYRYIAEKKGKKYIVSTKFQKENSKLGNRIIQDTVKAVKKQKADKGIVIASCGFTEGALEYAKEQKIQLMDKATFKAFCTQLQKVDTERDYFA